MAVKRIAVASCAFGEHHEKLSQLTYPYLKEYARKIGADFVAFRERKYLSAPSHFEKFQIADLLRDGVDAVLWADCDLVINPESPSIFEIVPEGCFAAVEDGVVRGIIAKELECIAGHLGRMPEDRGFVYFNSGFFIACKGQERLFEVPDRLDYSVMGCYDQTLLNYRVAAYRMKYFALDSSWNVFWNDEKRIPSAKVVHFAGFPKTNFDELRRRILRISPFRVGFVCRLCGGKEFGHTWTRKRPARYTGDRVVGSHAGPDGSRHPLFEEVGGRGA